MKIAVYSTKNYEKMAFSALQHKHQLTFIEESLSVASIDKARGLEGVCCFVTDLLDATVIRALSQMGIKLIALRSAGFDHVDLEAAKCAGITVVRVPQYSPQAVAEFAVALILLLSRNILKSVLHGFSNNFSLDELMGFNLYKKTIGIIGTGNIGTAFAKIMHGFGCQLLAVDPVKNPSCLALNVRYVTLDELLCQSDIVSLHCPLNNQTKYLMNAENYAKMKKGAMLINTSRGGLCDTSALIQALKSNHLGYAGLDVYENEKPIFFKNHGENKIHDELFLKLQNLPNVIITPHQAFLTKEAIENIVQTTINNITGFEQADIINEVRSTSC